MNIALTVENFSCFLLRFETINECDSIDCVESFRCDLLLTADLG